MLDRLIKYSGLKLSLNDPQWGRGGGSRDDEQAEQDRQEGSRPDHRFEDRPGNRPERPGRKPGGEPNGGPEGSKPDIEQMWEDFNKKIARFMKKRQSGGGGNGGKGFRSPIRLSRLIVFAALVLGLSVWISNGIFIVQDGQTAVVSTLGRFSYLAQPGTNWIMPEPVQSYHIVDTSRLNTVEVGYRSTVTSRVPKEALMATADGSYADVQISVAYRITNPADWLFNGTDVDGTIRAMAESVVRQRVAQMTFDQILYGDHAVLTNGVAETLQASLNQYKSGVKIENVMLQTVREPVEVRAAWDDLVKIQDENASLKTQAQTYAQTVINRANEAAASQLADAQAYRNRVVTIAQGDTARFIQVLEQYRKAPGVTRDRMYLDTMQDIYTHSSKILVDAKNITSITIPPVASAPDVEAASDAKKAEALAAGRNAAANSTVRNVDNTGAPAAKNASLPKDSSDGKSSASADSGKPDNPAGQDDAEVTRQDPAGVDSSQAATGDANTGSNNGNNTGGKSAAAASAPASAGSAAVSPDSPAATRSRDPVRLRSREGR